jgi:hypothetical protein
MKGFHFKEMIISHLVNNCYTQGSIKVLYMKLVLLLFSHQRLQTKPREIKCLVKVTQQFSVNLRIRIPVASEPTL